MSDIKAIDLHEARFHARDLSERLLVLYWVPEKDKAYHADQAHEALRQAAEAMGYALAYLPKDDALPTDWIDDSNEDERSGLVIHNIAS